MAAVLEPAKAGKLLRAIDAYCGQPTTREALILSALLFQRLGNIRQMEWDWVTLADALITIPAIAMKRTKEGPMNGRPHLVPRSKQAGASLAQMQKLTGHGRVVFPSLLSGEKPT